MGKTRGLFKKNRDTNSIAISCKDGHNKGQNGYGPKKKQKILKRGGKNTQKNYTKKIFMIQIIMMV